MTKGPDGGGGMEKDDRGKSFPGPSGRRDEPRASRHKSMSASSGQTLSRGGGCLTPLTRGRGGEQSKSWHSVLGTRASCPHAGRKPAPGGCG